MTLQLSLELTSSVHAELVKVPCLSTTLYEFYGFIFHNTVEPMWHLEIPLPSDTLEDEIQPQYLEFLRRVWNPDKFGDLIQVAMAMNSHEAVELLCAKMALHLKYVCSTVSDRVEILKHLLEYSEVIHLRVMLYGGAHDWTRDLVPIVPDPLPRFRTAREQYFRYREALNRWILAVRLNPILLNPDCENDFSQLWTRVVDADRIFRDSKEKDLIFHMGPEDIANERTFMIRQFLHWYGPFVDTSTFLHVTVPAFDLESDDDDTSIVVGEANRELTLAYQIHDGNPTIDLFESDGGSLAKYGEKLGRVLTKRMNRVAPILFPWVKTTSEKREVVKELIRVTYLQSMIHFRKVHGMKIEFFRGRMREVEVGYVKWLRTYLKQG